MILNGGRPTMKKACGLIERRHLYALSSMMHAFAALEGHVNRIAYAILREPQFPYFVAQENRTVEFEDLVSKWDGSLSSEKKTQFLLGQRHATYPASLIPNLCELTAACGGRTSGWNRWSCGPRLTRHPVRRIRFPAIRIVLWTTMMP